MVFLDIQMPGCTGLDVVASLGQPRPAIIFCTAFDQHAVDAFELHAVDYLLKPVTRARLDTALARIAPEARPHRRCAGGPTPRCRGRRFASSARRGARFHVVPAAEVVAFSFEDGQTRLHTRPTSCGCSRRWRSSCAGSTRAISSRCRAPSSCASTPIREAKPNSDGTGQIVLANGTAVEVSRRRWRPLLDELELTSLGRHDVAAAQKPAC